MTDLQSEAYRGSGPADWISKLDLTRMIEAGELMPVLEDAGIRSPDKWHATGWDAGREPPKTES